MDALELRAATGCELVMCKDALRYAESHGGGKEMATAYLKAKTFAVKTSCSFDARVQRFMQKEVQENAQHEV